MSPAVKKYNYNFFHITHTGYYFFSNALYIKDSIDELEKLKAHISEKYEGQATPVVDDIISKIQEHMQLVKSCNEAMVKYIQYVRENAKKWDDTYGDGIVGNIAGNSVSYSGPI